MRKLLPAALALLALAGCDSPVTPGALAGTYVLERYDGAALPKTWESELFVSSLLADTLRLEADRTGSRTSLYRTVHVSEGERTFRAHREFVYAVRGGEIEIAFHCTSGPCSIGPAHHVTARRVPRGLVVTELSSELVFRHVE